MSRMADAALAHRGRKKHQCEAHGGESNGYGSPPGECPTNKRMEECQSEKQMLLHVFFFVIFVAYTFFHIWIGIKEAIGYRYIMLYVYIYIYITCVICNCCSNLIVLLASKCLKQHWRPVRKLLRLYGNDVPLCILWSFHIIYICIHLYTSINYLTQTLQLATKSFRHLRSKMRPVLGQVAWPNWGVKLRIFCFWAGTTNETATLMMQYIIVNQWWLYL